MPAKTVQSIAFVLIAALGLWAQTPSPAHLGAESPGLAVQEDPEYKNVLVGSVLASASYDTQALYTATPTGGNYSGDFRYALQPSLAFQQTHPHLSWTVSYTPGASISQHVSDQFQYTQNAGGELVWTPSSRFLLRLRQDYSVSTNPFEQVGREPLLPELGGLFGPNYQSVLPYTKRETMISNAELVFRLGPHSAVGLTGGYQQFDYNAIANYLTSLNTSLIPSHSYNGSVFFSQQLSRAHTAGVQYAYFDIYSEPSSRIQAQDVMLFDRWQITSRHSLTVFGGAEYDRMHQFEVIPLASLFVGAQVFGNSWRPTGGVTYAYRGNRNALEIQGIRSTTNGGGLMNATTTTNGSIGFRSRFTKRWTGNARLQISDQESLNQIIKQSFRSTWAGAGLAYDVSRHFSVRLDYAYVRQTGQALLYLPGNQQLVQFSLDFHFLKPVGR
jgi:hypothetical protein